MKPRFRRWIALLLLAATAFAQASVSLAACPMDRGALVQTIAAAAAPHCEMGTHVKQDVPRYANRCVAHCTADLQLAGLPTAIVRSPADTPVLVVAAEYQQRFSDTGLEVPPPGTPPPRILLHSFLL